MDTTVLIEDAVIEIDGTKYYHHPNGGGLIADEFARSRGVF